MYTELDKKQSLFDLPSKKFFLGDPQKDLSVSLHGQTVSSPLGPAAGPHTQLAQNIVLAWLGGSRVIELKTVQIMDELEIPRPCIDMNTIGYNVEWSQELKLAQSAEEYVKASMLIEILSHGGLLPLAPGFDRCLLDLSAGYDLKGIQSAPVQQFFNSMNDASALVDRLRTEIPAEYKKLKDLPFPKKISSAITISTFHGCPPDEIERIVEFLLEKMGLNCVVKLNPTLLGKAELNRLLHDAMGYHELKVPDEAFQKDTQWGQAVDMVGRLRERARELNLSLGVKFSNTLLVENHRQFFPKDQKVMYMSGAPLHVLAMNLVKRFKDVFGADLPMSFSAGIDRSNVADTVSMGLCPVTFCSDLLKVGGYSRQEGYSRELLKRMDEEGAASIGDFVLLAHGQAEQSFNTVAEKEPAGIRKMLTEDVLNMLKTDKAARKERFDRFLVRWAGCHDRDRAWAEQFYGRWVRETARRNVNVIVPSLENSPRYSKAENSREPQKVGSALQLFDCMTCDKCIPVCPNNANFSFTVPPGEIPVIHWTWTSGQWKKQSAPALTIKKRHQIGNFSDFCNECGNCDVFCPETGGPYVMKPRFFGTKDRWTKLKEYDGFFIEKTGSECIVHGRFIGQEHRLSVRPDGACAYQTPDGTFALDESRPDVPPTLLSGKKPAEGYVLDLTHFQIMNCLRKAVLSETEINYVQSGI